MALPPKLNKAIRLMRRARGLARPSTTLLLVSHMRSRSSMLSHVLGSHARIVGYYEMSRSYRTLADLTRMKMAHLLDGFEKPKANYYLDKILHNRFEVSDEVATSHKARFVFLVRAPATSISSMLELGKKRAVPECQTAETAQAYYIDRLRDLEDLARRCHGNIHFIESDQLIENTTRELDRLTQWLALDTPLQAHYDRFDKTGVGSYGDTSNSILRGVIHDNRDKPAHDLPDSILAPAVEAYNQHVAHMNKYAV